MASLQKYFDYSFGTECGIPGVEMTGSEEDWIRLSEKTKKLETLLVPIMDEIGLGKWSVFSHLDLLPLFLNISYRIDFHTFHFREPNNQEQSRRGVVEPCVELERNLWIGC